MYPIPASRDLTMFEIADHWSREIEPHRKKMELFDDLCKAWWMGEFRPAKGMTRQQALTHLFKQCREELPFWINGENRPETRWIQPDGSVEILPLSLLPVPSANPDDWTDEDCKAAYEALAKDVSNEAFSIIERGLVSITLSEREFSRWTRSMGYTRPNFWASVSSTPVELPTTPAEALPERALGNVAQFVREYIAGQKAVGKNPTQSGMEAEAKRLGRKGGRDRFRAEFKKQLGLQAPGRGRPTK